MNICRFGSNTHEKKNKDFGVLSPFEIPGWRWQLSVLMGKGGTYEQVKGGRQVGTVEIEIRCSLSRDETTTARGRRWGTFTRTTVTT